MRILYDVLAQHAKDDAGLQSHAKALASPGGAVFGARRTLSHTGAGGASDQGGAGGAGIGGWVHLSDLRNPPDFGRIAWYVAPGCALADVRRLWPAHRLDLDQLTVC